MVGINPVYLNAKTRSMGHQAGDVTIIYINHRQQKLGLLKNKFYGLKIPIPNRLAVRRSIYSIAFFGVNNRLFDLNGNP